MRLWSRIRWSPEGIGVGLRDLYFRRQAVRALDAAIIDRLRYLIDTGGFHNAVAQWPRYVPFSRRIEHFSRQVGHFSRRSGNFSKLKTSELFLSEINFRRVKLQTH